MTVTGEIVDGRDPRAPLIKELHDARWELERAADELQSKEQECEMLQHAAREAQAQLGSVRAEMRSKIREVVEACQSLALDSDMDREVLITKLVRRLGG